MKYMLMMHAPGSGWEKSGIATWPANDIQGHMGFMMRLYQDLQAAGELVGAEGLASPEHAKIVRSNAGGDPVVTDGPFAEAKEFLAGYWIVDVETPQRAYEIAARASSAPGLGGAPMHMPIEVREVMSAPSVEP